MTIISALITQCRREYGDEPKSTRVLRAGNGSINLFNAGKFPIVEGSYSVFVGTSARVENTHYTIDLDSGDLRINSTPPNGIEVKLQHKYAVWRDQNWLEAINNAVEDLNARGFFRQVVRNTSIIRLSANVQVYAGPSACVDMYEFLVSNNGSVSGSFSKPYVNWSYQQDANKLVLGNKPSAPNRAAVSYLRKLATASAATMAIDVLDQWETMVKKKAGSNFYQALAGKIAKQGNATVDEGHFSFTNLRAMARDLNEEYERLASRKKPTRPAKDMQFFDPNGGTA